MYTRKFKKRKKPSQWMGYAMFAVFAVVYIVMAGRTGKAISNTLSGTQSAQETVLEATAAPQTTKTAQVMIAQEVTFDRLDFYALQTGAYSEMEAAQEAAQTVQAGSGAGYIHQDVLYRVFAGIYFERDEAENVKKQLAEQGVDSYIYAGGTGRVELSVTATAARASALSNAYTTWQNVLFSHRLLSDSVDCGDLSVEAACEQLAQDADALKKAWEALEGDMKVDDSAGVLSGIKSVLEEYARQTQALAENSQLETIDFGAQIKYNMIDTVMRYKQFIVDISNRIS